MHHCIILCPARCCCTVTVVSQGKCHTLVNKVIACDVDHCVCPVVSGSVAILSLFALVGSIGLCATVCCYDVILYISLLVGTVASHPLCNISAMAISINLSGHDRSLRIGKYVNHRTL